MRVPPNARQLLIKDPKDRLGTKNGVRDVLAHPWFADIDVDKLLKCKLEPPFKPNLSANAFDVSNFDQAFTSEEAVVSVVQPKNIAKI